MIVPTSFHDDTLDIRCEHCGYAGTIALSDVREAPGLTEGRTDARWLIINCPNCGASSAWPVGGGADAELGQELHLRYRAQGKRQNFTAARNEVAALVAEMDGPERFRFHETKNLAEVRAKVVGRAERQAALAAAASIEPEGGEAAP